MAAVFVPNQNVDDAIESEAPGKICCRNGAMVR